MKNTKTKKNKNKEYKIKAHKTKTHKTKVYKTKKLNKTKFFTKKSIKLSNKRVYDKYTKYVNEILNTDKTKWNFKCTGLYTEILEHILPYHSNLYFREIKKKFYNFYNKYKNFLIKLCHKNDLYGKPYKINFKNFATCSSTNLRYILHSLLILTFMQKHN